MENKRIDSICSNVYLSDHLSWEILVHMPTKSLMRFKSVSKLWYSIIINPDFVKEHSLHGGCFRGLIITDFVANYPYLHHTGSLNRIFYANYNGDNCNSCESLKYFYHCTWDLRVFSGVTPVVKGLIGLYNDDCFTLCNVSTQEMVKLPGNSKVEYYNYHLGFEPVEDVYKVLKVYVEDGSYSTFKTEIFTVGRDAGLAWRSIDNAPADCDKQSLCMDGTLYWMPSEDSEFGSLIAFHLDSESFETIPLPDISICCANLAQIGGGPGLVFCCSTNRYRYIDIWMMKNDVGGGSERWTNNRYRLPMDELIWAGTLRCGEMLLAKNHLEDYPVPIFKYDHIKNEMKLIKLDGYSPSESQKDGLDDSLQMCYHEESIIPLAPLLRM